ncbi:MAG: Ig-like domain-containing protein [Muribaculaceae bacterium]|nr:Ig-like domain-containing protein [Muribaculaceae bacterium]
MKINRHISILAGGAAALLSLWGCASIGSPSGGARDEDPPRFVSANPKPGSTNVDPSNIYLDFNELVNVKDAFEKVVLSPPGKSTPRVTTRGRRVVVNITDTLLPNTTYTIDFGDAIEDNNEGNKLSSFAYTFSTGETLDSLRISGMVLGAEDMEPQQGVFVGAYTSDSDTAFTRMPFERLARTDEYGRFILRGLRDTTYRLFALKDLDNDRHYANPEEDMAWYADTIRPTCERITATDTMRNLLTGEIDTIVERQRTRFLPNNILLRMFNSGLKTQYMLSYTRPDSARLEFIFNAPSAVRPRIRIANDSIWPDPLLAESSVGNDTLKFWLPRELAARDTLQLALEFEREDLQTGLVSTANDTVKLMKPKQKASKKKVDKKKVNKEDSAKVSEDRDSLPPDSVPPVPVPTFKITAKGPDVDISRPLEIEVPVPLARLDSAAFRLEENADTVWKPVASAYRLELRDTLSERRFKIEYPWKRGMTYKLTADSVAATDMYGAESEKLSYEFKTKPEEDLSNLKVTLQGLDSVPAFVQLIVSGDKPKYTAKVVDGIADFKGIESGKYYMRLYEDFNGDGKYTTGSYRLLRFFREEADTLGYDSLVTIAPDLVYYFPKTINVKKNWDVEQTWNVFETALDLQKPDKLKKNKPKRNNQNSRQEEDEDEEDEDEFGTNPFAPNNRNRRNGNNRNTNMNNSRF